MALSRRRAAAALGVFAGLVVLALAGLWPGTKRAQEGGSLARVRAAGVLRVGYAVEPPYAFVRADQTITGEAPEVARETARRLGLRVEWIHTHFESLIPELRSGRFDMIAAGMFINADRQRLVRFSRPTLRVRPGWLTLLGNPRRLSAYSHLPDQPDIVAAVLAGSVEAQELARLGLPASRLLVVPDARTGLAAVANGTAHGLALSMPTVSMLAQEMPRQLAAVPAQQDPLAPQAASETALVMRLDDHSLAEAVDAQLAQYLGSQAHLAVLARFNLGADDLPQSVSAHGS